MIVDQATVLGRPATLCVLRRVGLALLVLTAVSVLGTASASASGDPAVDHYILKTPMPGWPPADPAVGQAVATTLSTTLSSELHQTVTVAADGWSPPTSSTVAGELLIVLARFPGTTVPAGATPGQLADDICSTAGATPGLVLPLSGIPDSASVPCATSSQSAITAVAWEQANVAAFVYGAGLSTTLVDQIAQLESAEIPATGITESSFPYILVGGAVVVVMLLVLVLVLRVRRRTHSAHTPAGAWPVATTGPAGWDYQSGSGGQPVDAQAAVARATSGPEPWAAAAGPAPWSATAGPLSTGAAEPGAYAPPATAYSRAAPTAQPVASVAPKPYTPTPFDNAAPYGSAPTGPAPYAPSRPSQRVAAERTSYGGTQSFPGAGAQEYAGPAMSGPAQSLGGRSGFGQQPPTPERPLEIGWHPTDGDPYHQRYWDGGRWTVGLEWDGATWVEEH